VHTTICDSDFLERPLTYLIIYMLNIIKTNLTILVSFFLLSAAVMTKFTSVSVTSDGYINSKPKNKHDLQIPDSSMFKW